MAREPDAPEGERVAARNALVQVYQQRMDKCTGEQFWAVALLASLCGFSVTQRDLFSGSLLVAVVAAVILLAVAVAAFVYLRHVIYRHYERLVDPLLERQHDSAETPAPDGMAGPGFLVRRFGLGGLRGLARWSGVLLYVGICLGMGAGTVILLIRI